MLVQLENLFGVKILLSLCLWHKKIKRQILFLQMLQFLVMVLQSASGTLRAKSDRFWSRSPCKARQADQRSGDWKTNPSTSGVIFCPIDAVLMQHICSLLHLKPLVRLANHRRHLKYGKKKLRGLCRSISLLFRLRL